MEVDSQLSQLLGTMSLEGQRRKSTFESDEPLQTSRTRPVEDAAMSDSSDSEDSTYQPSPSACSSSSASTAQGCAYLQAVHGQIRAGSYATTSGDYLETIFTHREALYAFPAGHRACALGFDALAQELAHRQHPHPHSQHAHRPDWDGDSEAVSAFRHEAWVIANTF